jgi:hypothetical protein
MCDQLFRFANNVKMWAEARKLMATAESTTTGYDT